MHMSGLENHENLKITGNLEVMCLAGWTDEVAEAADHRDGALSC